MKLSRQQRLIIGRRRLVSVLKKHAIATMRTLENKISDGGPNPQRIDPHILTIARNALVKEGVILEHRTREAPWYHLAATPSEIVTNRLDLMDPVYKRVANENFRLLVGQTLEIAVYRALLARTDPNYLGFLGAYLNLEEHDDSRLYRKEEPPSAFSGNLLPSKMKLDFVLIHREAGFCGIEVKNIREWLYPDRPEVRDLLLKCVTQDAVPILIARRIHFSTFLVLNAIGGITHQVFNQHFPYTAQELAEAARDKNSLGYHDIRVGNEPDARLQKFINISLPELLPEARQRFEANKEYTTAYVEGRIPLSQLVNIVLRRKSDAPMNFENLEDEEEEDFEEPYPDPDDY